MTITKAEAHILWDALYDWMKEKNHPHGSTTQLALEDLRQKLSAKSEGFKVGDFDKALQIMADRFEKKNQRTEVVYE